MLLKVCFVTLRSILNQLGACLMQKDWESLHINSSQNYDDLWSVQYAKMYFWSIQMLAQFKSSCKGQTVTCIGNLACILHHSRYWLDTRRDLIMFRFCWMAQVTFFDSVVFGACFSLWYLGLFLPSHLILQLMWDITSSVYELWILSWECLVLIVDAFAWDWMFPAC